jgi:hypothetical protein
MIGRSIEQVDLKLVSIGAHLTSDCADSIVGVLLLDSLPLF